MTLRMNLKDVEVGDKLIVFRRYAFDPVRIETVTRLTATQAVCERDGKALHYRIEDGRGIGKTQGWATLEKALSSEDLTRCHAEIEEDRERELADSNLKEARYRLSALVEKIQRGYYKELTAEDCNSISEAIEKALEKKRDCLS